MACPENQFVCWTKPKSLMSAKSSQGLTLPDLYCLAFWTCWVFGYTPDLGGNATSVPVSQSSEILLLKTSCDEGKPSIVHWTPLTINSHKLQLAGLQAKGTQQCPCQWPWQPFSFTFQLGSREDEKTLSIPQNSRARFALYWLLS